jgi:hypothetical protein
MCLRHLNQKEKNKNKEKVQRESWAEKTEKKESIESSLVHDYMVVTDFFFFFFSYLFMPAEIGWN